MTNHAPFKTNWEEASFYIEAAEVTPVLVVGAGGLGCEIVKNLALSGVKNIHLVDMDTVDYTNLNRQFMFRKSDVGKSKADAIASFVSRRCPGVKITTHKKKVQELPFQLYTQFPVIVGGLDNVEARKYLNHIAHLLNETSDETVCQYIDGATEGFEGQALLVDPFKTSCYECSLLGGLAEKPKVNYCTIANTPRTPEHCIQYALEVLWDDERKGETRDNDNLEHMKWIFEKASQRAAQFNIEGVTEMLTLGVTKNIIPAIASTNALIAAVLTNEVLKLLSGCNPTVFFLLLSSTTICFTREAHQSAARPTQLENSPPAEPATCGKTAWRRYNSS